MPFQRICPRERVSQDIPWAPSQQTGQLISHLTGRRPCVSLWPKSWDHWPTCHTSRVTQPDPGAGSVECGFQPHGGSGHVALLLSLSFPGRPLRWPPQCCSTERPSTQRLPALRSASQTGSRPGRPAFFRRQRHRAWDALTGGRCRVSREPPSDGSALLLGVFPGCNWSVSSAESWWCRIFLQTRMGITRSHSLPTPWESKVALYLFEVSVATLQSACVENRSRTSSTGVCPRMHPREPTFTIQ